MSRSKGPLSPIQPASATFRWITSPKTPVRTTQSSLARPSPESPDFQPKPRTACRRPPPSPLASRSTRQQAAQRTPQPTAQRAAQPAAQRAPQPAAQHSTPQSAVQPKPPTVNSRPPRHPPKRPPSARDIKSDDLLPTPEKVTPSKRSVDGKKKLGELSRTPFRSLNTGTPTSTTSSKTSLSSTASLLTPDLRMQQTPQTPAITPEFRVPSYSISSKSRQRLKRL